MTKEDRQAISRFNQYHCQTFIKNGEIIKGYLRFCRVGDYFIVLPKEKALLEIEDSIIDGDKFDLVSSWVYKGPTPENGAPPLL